jgi:hypothetical protein
MYRQALDVQTNGCRLLLYLSTEYHNSSGNIIILFSNMYFMFGSGALLNRSLGIHKIETVCSVVEWFTIWTLVFFTFYRSWAEGAGPKFDVTILPVQLPRVLRSPAMVTLNGHPVIFGGKGEEGQELDLVSRLVGFPNRHAWSWNESKSKKMDKFAKSFRSSFSLVSPPLVPENICKKKFWNWVTRWIVLLLTCRVRSRPR